MPNHSTRVLLVGAFGPGALERSFVTAFQALGCEGRSFDIAAVVERYCRLGHLGRLFNTFVPVEPWIRKANREMVVDAESFRPDVMVVFGQNHALPGALAQVRAMRDVSTVYVWPDPLLNLTSALIASLPLYDLVATYSRATVPYFRSLGARRVEWVPLACDPQLHPPNFYSPSDRAGFGADISFIGRWRPERAHALGVLLSELSGSNVKIWGPEWGRRCRPNSALLRAWQRRSPHGEEFAKIVAASRININIIDPTNYPAANMRFFEIPCAGGLQVSSLCPEMEGEFEHGKTVFYYRSPAEQPGLVRTLLADEGLCRRVARAGQEKVLGAHTHTHRAKQILEALELPSS